MDVTETFIKHGEYNVENILKIINDNNLDWDEFTERQKLKNTVHYLTKTIPIIFDKTFDFDNLNAVPTEKYPLFKTEILNIENIIKVNTGEDGSIMRAILVKLPSMMVIPPHVDTAGESLVICRRIHLPIVTNNKCYFTVGHVEKILKEGELWEINNDKQVHSVHNYGNNDRIHLIVDWIKK
jgi:hypothetical protein